LADPIFTSMMKAGSWTGAKLTNEAMIDSSA